ncbi:hypothetical protein [Nocardioides sp.]|uniref:hypothetical protein n=1 Tax=Nocardioides sp. TaxID=35761 RepID=UPI002B276677|nr:hypothetical protein [Nocardioides sp.]
MPTDRAERAPRSGLLGAALALVLVATACAGVDRGTTPSDGTSPGSSVAGEPRPPLPAGTPGTLGSSPGVVEGLPVPPDLDAAFTGLLEQRARAVLDGDRAAFVDTLDGRNATFLIEQNGYFDNLVQLPLGEFSYEIDPTSLVRSGRSYSVVVQITTRLDGFDASAARTLDRFRFDRVGGPRARRYVLASVTDRAWEQTYDIGAQPWETRPIQVRRGAGVLGIFDDASVVDAPALMRAMERSIADVAARVPYPWDRTVVVYALSDTEFIRSIDDLPGSSPDDLDGIAFTVPAGPGDPTTVATRIVLNPRLLERGGVSRERLLRHELTHVALGDRDDNAPVWLSEGIAEWVSVQVLPEEDRRIGVDALAAARRGVETMPDDESFNGADATVNYAISWWVCEYLEKAYGPSAPWNVLDAFAAPGMPESPTIQALLQISLAKLAKRGTALLVETYAPTPSPTPSPRPSPRPSARSGDTPSATPTDDTQ